MVSKSKLLSPSVAHTPRKISLKKILRLKAFSQGAWGLATVASFLVGGLSPWLTPLAFGAGALGLLFSALRHDFEAFLLIVAFSLACLYLTSYPPLAALCYGGYVVLPLVVYRLYQKVIGTEAEEPVPSVFHVFSSFFSGMAFIFGLFWPSLLEGAPPWAFFIPGALGLAVGSFFTVLFSCKALKVPSPAQKYIPFGITAFDYWWIVIDQAGALFFTGDDRLLFGNMLIAGFLPFAIRGWQKIQEKFFLKKGRWASLIWGLSCLILVIPLVGLILYTLCEPWVKQEEDHGDR